jgi:hypothetical protein
MSGLVQAQRKQKYDHVQEEICNVGQSVTSFGKLRIGAEETREASGEGDLKPGVPRQCSIRQVNCSNSNGAWRVA